MDTDGHNLEYSKRPVPSLAAAADPSDTAALRFAASTHFSS